MSMTLSEASTLLKKELTSDRESVPISRRFFVQDGSVPDMLWHYTSAEGLLGIVSERQLRATDVFFFNDSSEVEYALALIDTALPEVRSTLGTGPARQVLDGVIQRIGALHRSLEFPYRMHAACFCEEEDLLSQWRGYGSFGGGFALGFSAQAILKHISETNLGIYRIWYERADQSELVRETVSSACNALMRISAEAPSGQHIKELARQAAEYAFRVLCQFALSLKTSAFREEKEWRIVDYVQMGRTVDFVVRHGVVVPYVVVSFPIHALNRVQVGPTLERQSAVRSVREVLRRYSVNHVTVSCSSIPLRT